MARKNIRIGLIGVGAAAQVNHIPALKRTEGLELVALCDREGATNASVTGPKAFVDQLAVGLKLSSASR